MAVLYFKPSDNVNPRRFGITKRQISIYDAWEFIDHRNISDFIKTFGSAKPTVCYNCEMINNKMMTVYGTKIITDIAFPLDLSQETETRYEVELSSNIPEHLENSITCGFYLYWAHGRNVYLYSDREFNGSEAEQPWCYEVEDMVKFYWVGGDRIIYYALGEKGNVDLLSFWFIHLLLPLYMTLENMYDFLHAGAVEVEGKPIFFIAPSMGGKSTMTDYFIKQGHPLISDDKVPTFIQDGKFRFKIPEFKSEVQFSY